MVRLTSITRGYKSGADRKRAQRQLERRYFSVFTYRDTQAEYALHIGPKREQPWPPRRSRI